MELRTTEKNSIISAVRLDFIDDMETYTSTFAVTRLLPHLEN